ncbi:hypothetical protein NIES22_65640 [Calothrix brevissima NIES-22]|nr:hypothetical protein NIES22_65640 [Calothrix brevissima NIES-22]
MNKTIVKVKEKEYSVSNITVVLKLNSGPLIHLRLSNKLDGAENKLSNEETFKTEFFQDICQEAEGSFAWGGQTIKFILVGYNSSEARTFELVGLVVKKDVIDWFNENNFKDKKQDYFIYQKSNGGNSWPWLNKVLGEKFEQPNPDFVDKIKFLFPDNACIWRYRDSNNFHFLNRTITFASRHLPEVQGWCAFDADKPLRLILFEEKKQDQTIPKLDQTWNPSHLFMPNRYSWNRWLDRSCTLSRDLNINTGQEIALIKQLVSDGSNGEDAQKGKNFQAQNPTRLLFTPGTINIGYRNIFCHTVSYEFKLPAFEDKESPSVTMKIEMDYPERQIGDNEVVSLRLPGKFQKWEKEKDEETKVKIAPPDLNNWGIIDEKKQSLKSGDDAVLYTQILSPTYSDKKYSGIYIKHEKDDEMIVDIHPCGIPLVLGSVQKYRPELEKADITLCGEKLAISVSSHSQSLASAEAIILDNSEIKLNHGKKIFGQAQQKVDFLSQNIELGSTQIEMNSGQAKINSLVNVSFPSPKVPTPNVPSSPVVAGLASGEVGGASNHSASSGANSSSVGSGSDKAVTKENNEAAPKQVFMKGLDGKTKVLQITPNTKISELKKALGYESADVYLTYGGKPLKEESTVADYPNIQKDSTLEIRGRLRGGGSGFSKVSSSSSTSSSPKNSTHLFKLMNDSTIQKFVKEDQKEEYARLIHTLPQSVENLDDLENFSKVANQIYNTLDFAQRDREMEEKGTDEMGQWAGKLQAEIYEQRDKMLKDNPNEIERYSLQNQFKNNFPDETIPTELQKIDIDPKLLIFTSSTKKDNDNPNDCGKFANKLFNMRQEQIKKTAKNSGNLKDIQETNKIKIEYKDSQDIPFPHHYKTSLTGNGEDCPIYTLEANTGKPFLLSPELHKYNSKADFEEKQDQSVKEVKWTRMSENIKNSYGI